MRSSIALPSVNQSNLPHHITRHQVINVLEACLFAEESLKKPLNTFLTINFPSSSNWVPGPRTRKEYRSARARFLHALRDWFAREGLANLYVYADENPSHGGTGPHIHILLHLPVENWVELRAKLFRCMRLAGGWTVEQCPDRKHTDSKRIGVHIGPTAAEGPLIERQSLVKARYILKGADPALLVEHDGKRMMLSQLPGSLDQNEPVNLAPQGNVQSPKRAGASVLLCAKARDAAGWIDKANLKLLSPYLTHQAIRATALSFLNTWDLTRQGAASGGAGAPSYPTTPHIGIIPTASSWGA
jgi:hypothetical protein